jgi:hypothetical protein
MEPVMTDEQSIIFKNDVNNIVDDLNRKYDSDVIQMLKDFQKAISIGEYSDIFTPTDEDEPDDQDDNTDGDRNDTTDDSGRDGSGDSGREEQDELDRKKDAEDLDKAISDTEDGDSEKDSSSTSTSVGRGGSKSGPKPGDDDYINPTSGADGNANDDLTDEQKKLKEESELAAFQKANQQKNRLIESMKFLTEKFKNAAEQTAYFKSMSISPRRITELKLLEYAFKVAPEGPLPYIKSASSDPLIISEANSIALVFKKIK